MPLPKKHAGRIQVGVVLGAAILLMTTVLRSQQTPPVGPVWEYATITSSQGTNGTRVTVCYAGSNGCRNEQASASDKDGGQEGVMMTAAKLGEKGWELAASTEGGSMPRTERILYFKRLRSAIHRGE